MMDYVPEQLNNLIIGETSMPAAEKYSLVRNILKTIGLQPEAVDDIIDRIDDWLSEKDDVKGKNKLEYPYRVRDDFLSPAEHSFYLVLKNTIGEQALVCPKVSLGDLFFARTKDPSQFRTATNKIDRKHVDFLLCDPLTVTPIVGIELDDKSHQREDRKTRDEFVEKVFSAANLKLIRIPTKQTYSVQEISNLLQPYFGKKETPVVQPVVTQPVSTNPSCPKCGGEMILRTAKSGANQGEKFWGCSHYPQCRGVMKAGG